MRGGRGSPPPPQGTGALLIPMASASRMLPREHGAYAQLGFPLATGLLMAPPPALSTVLLALAAVVFFLANEPAAILIGRRGIRLQEKDGMSARNRVRVLGGVGMGTGLAGLFLGWPGVWPEILVPGLAVACLVPMVRAGTHKTLMGELVVITVFSTLVPPLAASSGAKALEAGLAAGVWWISFVLGTLEVHAIKARAKKTPRSQWTRWASPLAAGVALGATLWIALGQATPLLRILASHGMEGGVNGGGPTLVPELVRLLPGYAAALLPPALATLVLSRLRVHPRHLKRVGWTLVMVNALTLILLLQG